MKMKLRTTTVAVVALMLGVVAGPALAQDEVVTADAETCVFEIVISDLNFLPGDRFPEPTTLDDDGFADRDAYLDENPDIGDDFRAYLDEQGLVFEDICVLGGNYVPGVAGIVDENGTNGTNGETTQYDEIDAVVLGAVITQPVDPPAAQVLGVSLPRTGLDAALIALMGVVLLGLGIVAVRGTGRKGHRA